MFKHFGAVGYAQWQATNYSINLTPTATIGAGALYALEHTSEQIYAAGLVVALLTKHGLFFRALGR